MKAVPITEVWFAVYKQNGDGTSRIVALFEDEEDANGFHANPHLYSVMKRTVRLTRVPLAIEPPAPIYRDLAFEYCRRMADPNFPDSEIGDFFDELKSFVKKYEEAAQSKGAKQ